MEWQKYYKTEQELINAMLIAKSDVTKYKHYQIVKGYIYIESFKKYYLKNGNLTDKQMTQLKRVAGEIYKNLNWDCYK